MLRPCGWDAAGGQLPIAGFYCFVCSGSSRELSERFSNSSCIFLHDLQRHVPRGQALVRQLQFRFQPGDLGLFWGELANLLPGLLALEHARIAQLSPFDDLGRMDALLTQTPPLACGNRNVVSGKVDKFLGRSNRTPPRRTTRSWPLEDVVVHWTIVVYDADRWVGHGKLVPSTRPAIRRTCY